MSAGGKLVVGQALGHEAGTLHVTGAAKYVDDLGVDTARLAHAWPVMAPHAHARVWAIDAAPALKLPGALAVLTAADVTGENDTGPARHDEPLFPDVVSFHGQAVAWTLAETEEQARLAAQAVRVNYEPLPAILPSSRPSPRTAPSPSPSACSGAIPRGRYGPRPGV